MQLTVDVSPRSSNPGTLALENTSFANVDQPGSYPFQPECGISVWGTWTVTATANTGFTFDHWVLNPAPSGFNTRSNPAVFPSDTIRSLTAYFTSGGSSTPAPSPPSSITASDGTSSDSIYVSWSASSGATSYIVYRSTSTSGLKPVVATPTSTNFTDTNITCGTTYYYWVAAKNSSGTSALSSYNSGYCDDSGGGGTEPPPAGGVNALSAVQAKTEIDETTGLVILDVRDKIYYDTGHLLCAENAAWNTAFEFVSYNVVADYKSIDLLIYDQDGTYALAAANYLAGEGFSTVYYITGGIEAWEAKGYETVTTSGPCSIPPMANAGEDQTVAENVLVSLDASNSSSSSGTLTYVWTQSSGPSVVLLNPTTATPTFTAPYVQEGGEELVFHLKVINDQQVADTDSVSVFVTWNQTNSPPIAKAGADQTVNESVSVTLNANGSTDPDGVSDIVSYSWTQTGGTPSVTLTNAGSAVATFTAPEVSAQTTLTFRVTVTDTEDNTDTDQVQVTVNNVATNPGAPVADAGDDLTVNESTNVTLDGSGSSTPQGTITNYQWTQTAGTGVTILNNGTENASFTAPAIDTDQQLLKFQLVVTNSADLDSPPDEVIITVNNVAVQGKPPIAAAGQPQEVYGGSTVTLNGSGSMDPLGGTIESYLWEQTYGPSVTLSDVSSPKPTFVAPLMEDDDVALLEFRLTVTDNDNNQDTDDVTIQVDMTPPPIADAGEDQIVKEKETVILDGSASIDEHDGGIQSYTWKQISGTEVNLTDSGDPAIVEFEAPVRKDSLEVLIFELTVENAMGLQGTDIIAITVKNNSSSGGCFISAME